MNVIGDVTYDKKDRSRDDRIDNDYCLARSEASSINTGTAKTERATVLKRRKKESCQKANEFRLLVLDGDDIKVSGNVAGKCATIIMKCRMLLFEFSAKFVQFDL